MKLSILIILFLTFSTFKLFAQPPENVDQLFQMSLSELMDVEVTTAGKKAEKVSDIPASVVVVTREDIERNGYQNLQEVLQNVLGMYVVEDYNVLGADIGVRGHKSARANEHLIMLVDGVKYTNAMYNNNPLNIVTVPVEAIDRVEIIRGPMSVIYGSGAFFGAINIITNDSFKEKPITIATTSVGSYDGKKVMVRAEDKTDDFHAVANGSVYDEKGLLIHLSDIATTPPTMYDGSTENHMARREIFFNSSITFKEFYTRLSYVRTRITSFVNFPMSKGNPTDLVQGTAAFGYRKKLSEVVTIDAKTTYINYDEKVYNNYYDSTYYPHYGVYDANSVELELDAFITPNDKLDMTFGLNYHHIPLAYIRIHGPSEGLPNLIAETSNGITTRAAFAQINYDIMEKLKVVAGLRVSQRKDYNVSVVFDAGPSPSVDNEKTVEADKVNWIPRVAAIYQLNDKHVFKLLYGEAIKSRSFHLSLASLYLTNQPELKQEEMKTYEINYIGALSSRFSITASLFRNEMNDLITRSAGVDSSGTYFQYDSNVGELETHGSEVSMTLKPFEDLSLKIGGVYQKTKDYRIKGIKVAFSPDWLGYLQASYSLSPDMTLSFIGNYVDDIEAYWDVAVQNNDPSRIRGRIGQKSSDYFLASLNFRVRNLFTKDLFTNLKITNLFDEEIRYPATNEVNWADKGYLGKGRSFLFSLGMKFL